jgi:hypothetical protein
MELFLRVAVPAHNNRTVDLTDDLRRLKTLVESKSTV